MAIKEDRRYQFALTNRRQWVYTVQRHSKSYFFFYFTNGSLVRIFVKLNVTTDAQPDVVFIVFTQQYFTLAYYEDFYSMIKLSWFSVNVRHAAIIARESGALGPTGPLGKASLDRAVSNFTVNTCS